MNETRQFLSADGWCYYSLDDQRAYVSIWDVALWEVLPDGLIIGLISASIAKTKGNIACLTAPPPIGGQYFLKGSPSDPREWPNPPMILESYPRAFGKAGGRT
jgi:hypothetical protein